MGVVSVSVPVSMVCDVEDVSSFAVVVADALLPRDTLDVEERSLVTAGGCDGGGAVCCMDGLRGIRGSGFTVEVFIVLMSVDWEYAVALVNRGTLEPPSSGWSEEGRRTLMAGSAEELILIETRRET